MLRPLGFAADFFRVLAEAEHQIGQLLRFFCVSSPPATKNSPT
jgi:hypothetical protein